VKAKTNCKVKINLVSDTNEVLISDTRDAKFAIAPEE
jgi:hypothetical protein